MEIKEHNEEKEFKYDCDEEYDLTSDQDGDHTEARLPGHKWSQAGHR